MQMTLEEAEVENERLRAQNEMLKAAFANMPATLECLAAMEREVQRARAIVEKEVSQFNTIVNRFYGTGA